MNSNQPNDPRKPCTPPTMRDLPISLADIPYFLNRYGVHIAHIDVDWSQPRAVAVAVTETNPNPNQGEKQNV